MKDSIPSWRILNEDETLYKVGPLSSSDYTYSIITTNLDVLEFRYLQKSTGNIVFFETMKIPNLYNVFQHQDIVIFVKGNSKEDVIICHPLM